MNKFKIGDKVQLNKLVGLSFGDCRYLQLNTLYSIVGYQKPGLQERKKKDITGCYRLSWTTPSGHRDSWWVSDLDIYKKVGQLMFAFMDSEKR